VFGGSSYYSNGVDSSIRTRNTKIISGDFFTIEMWVYPMGEGGVLIGYESAELGNFLLGVESPSHPSYPGQLVGAVRNQRTYRFGNTVPFNEWSHIAVVVGGWGITAYVNGVGTATLAGYGPKQTNKIFEVNEAMKIFDLELKKL